MRPFFDAKRVAKVVAACDSRALRPGRFEKSNRGAAMQCRLSATEGQQNEIEITFKSNEHSSH